MKSHPLTWFLLMAILGFGFTPGTRCALGSGEKVVTVTGSAVGESLSAQDEARSDALRKAVEQACGTFINAQTNVANYEAVYDHIMSLAPGFVNGYDTEKEWREDGMSHCTLRVTVSPSLVEKEWAAFAHTYKRAGYPKVVVVIVEDDDVDDDKPPITEGLVQSSIENFFLGKNVTLMDKGQSDSVRQRDLELAAINDDVNKLAATAAAFKAEVVVYGQASAKYAGTVPVAGRNAHRWDITLTVRCILADSAQILASNVYRPEKRTTSTTRGSGANALVELGRDSAPDVLRDLASAWNSRDVNRRIAHLNFMPCSRSNFKAIQAALADVRGVQGGAAEIELRELVNEVAGVEINWSYDMNRLADVIEELDVEGMSFEITEMSGNRIEVRIDHGG